MSVICTFCEPSPDGAPEDERELGGCIGPTLLEQVQLSSARSGARSGANGNLTIPVSSSGGAALRLDRGLSPSATTRHTYTKSSPIQRSLAGCLHDKGYSVIT